MDSSHELGLRAAAKVMEMQTGGLLIFASQCTVAVAKLKKADGVVLLPPSIGGPLEANVLTLTRPRHCFRVTEAATLAALSSILAATKKPARVEDIYRVARVGLILLRCHAGEAYLDVVRQRAPFAALTTVRSTLAALSKRGLVLDSGRRLVYRSNAPYCP